MKFIIILSEEELYLTMKFVAALFLLAGHALAFSPNAAFVSKPKITTTSTSLFEYGASSTSFYTKTEKQDSYMSLEEVLDAKCKDDKVRQVIKDMLDVCAEITEALRTALVTVEGSMNDFGMCDILSFGAFSLIRFPNPS